MIILTFEQDAHDFRFFKPKRMVFSDDGVDGDDDGDDDDNVDDDDATCVL